MSDIDTGIPIAICGSDELNHYKGQSFTHIIKIVNPGVSNVRPPWFLGEYLPLSFGDVVSNADAQNYNTIAPSIEDIQSALDFSRKALSIEKSSIIVSCDYGASRSPALAYVIWADKLGPGREQEAFDYIMSMSPEAVPNNLVVALGDLLLKRNGALTKPLQNLNISIIASIQTFS
jgi:predicted protein tyrosine phosphatase